MNSHRSLQLGSPSGRGCRSCGGPVEPDDGTLIYYHFGWCTPAEAAARRDEETRMRVVEYRHQRLADLDYDVADYDALV